MAVGKLPQTPAEINADLKDEVEKAQDVLAFLRGWIVDRENGQADGLGSRESHGLIVILSHTEEILEQLKLRIAPTGTQIPIN